MDSTLQQGFRLNDFVIEPIAGEISGPGGTHHLQPKAIDVLVRLAQNPGEVVDRNDILDEVWGGRPVADEALTRCIHDIRHALGDDSHSPTYVQTVPRRGYRLLVAPEPLPGPGSDIPTRQTDAEPKRPDLRGRVAIAFGGAVAVLVAALVYYTLTPSTPSFAFNARDTAIVTTFQNYTEDTLLGDALRQAFRVALEQSRYVQVLSDREMQNTLRRMVVDTDANIDREVATEIALREGSKALIAGAVGRAGERYTLSAEIVDPGTGRTVYSNSFIADDADQILSNLQAITEDIRNRLGESLESINQSNLPLERVTTHDLDALKSYSMALQKMVSGENEAALAFFEHAIEQDPEFALAHAKLGTLCRSLGLDAEKTLRHYKTAVSLNERLTEKERLYVQGSMAWYEEPAAMRARWSIMATKYPEEAGAHHNLGIISWNYENDFVEAKAAQEIAANLPHPLRYGSLIYLGYANLGLGNIDAAIANFEESYGLDNNPVGSALAEGYIAAGRYADAEQFLAKSLKHSSPTFRLWAMGKQLVLYVDRGQFTQALALTRDFEDMATELDSAIFISNAQFARLALLEVLAEQSDLRDGIVGQLKSELANLEKHRMQLGFDPAVRASMTAQVAARHGLIEEAELAARDIALSGKAQGFPIAENYLQILEAEIALQSGNPSAAITILKEVIAKIDLWQAHDTLARAFEQTAQIDAALEQYKWLTTNRGRAFAEWNDDFFGKEFSVIDYALAHYHLGRLYTAKTNQTLARTHFENFLEHWHNADSQTLALEDARDQLADL